MVVLLLTPFRAAVGAAVERDVAARVVWLKGRSRSVTHQWRPDSILLAHPHDSISLAHLHVQYDVSCPSVFHDTLQPVRRTPLGRSVTWR